MTTPIKSVKFPGFVKPDSETQVFFYEQDCYVLSNLAEEVAAARVTLGGNQSRGWRAWEAARERTDAWRPK